MPDNGLLAPCSHTHTHESRYRIADVTKRHLSPFLSRSQSTTRRSASALSDVEMQRTGRSRYKRTGQTKVRILKEADQAPQKRQIRSKRRQITQQQQKEREKKERKKEGHTRDPFNCKYWVTPRVFSWGTLQQQNQTCPNLKKASTCTMPE